MADAAEDLDQDTPETELEEGADPPAPQPEGDEPEGDDDELVVSFDGEGDAPPPSEDKDTHLVRHLREQLREKDRQLKAVAAQSAPQPIEVGEKPSLGSCDYDETRFEEELDAWKERSAKAKQAEDEAKRVQEAQKADWDKRLVAVNAQKAELGAKDYDQAAEEVKATFNDAQQALLIHAADNPAKLIYALGKNPAKAAELAKITNPVELVKALVKLEGKLTVTSRKAPPPEQVARGSASLSPASDKHRERLEKEAERTGDRTAIIAYNRQLRAQGRKTT